MANAQKQTDLKLAFTETEKSQLADKLYTAKTWQEKLLTLLRQAGETAKDTPHLTVKIDNERTDAVNFIARMDMKRFAARATNWHESMTAALENTALQDVRDIFNGVFRGGSTLEKRHEARVSGIEAETERGCESRFLKLVEKFDIQPPPNARRAGMAA